MFKALIELLNSLFKHLTPEERQRRIKDEIDKLEMEKYAIFVTKATLAKAHRVSDIDKRLSYLNKLLDNYKT